jgi:hypothetical protein
MGSTVMMPGCGSSATSSELHRIWSRRAIPAIRAAVVTAGPPSLSPHSADRADVQADADGQLEAGNRRQIGDPLLHVDGRLAGFLAGLEGAEQFVADDLDGFPL